MRRYATLDETRAELTDEERTALLGAAQALDRLTLANRANGHELSLQMRRSLSSAAAVAALYGLDADRVLDPTPEGTR